MCVCVCVRVRVCVCVRERERERERERIQLKHETIPSFEQKLKLKEKLLNDECVSEDRWT